MNNKFISIITSKFFIGTAVVAFALLAITTPSRAQFGLDPCCAIISAGLKSVSSLLSGVVAKPLGVIQQTQQQVAQFEQQVVWPVGAITQGRQLAAQTQSQFSQMANLGRIPLSSASLPSAQQLEAALLSKNGANVPLVSNSFAAVYGAQITADSASTQVRNVSDMTDAEAQAAMKKALEIDAIAEIEIRAVESINQQLENASPGSADILAAEAATWQLRATAASQSAMAELLRVRSVQLANQSAAIKFSALHTKTLNGITGSAVNQGVK